MENTLAVGPTIKIVIVGDDLVGKTSLINKFSNSEVPIARTSTVFQSIQSFVDVAGVQVPVQIWDTTGKKQYEIMIKSIYEDANIVLILFSVAHRETYNKAIQQWYKQVALTNQKALKVFVGNKTDMRNQGVTGGDVQEKEAKLKIEHELGCKYVQCSAVNGDGVKHLFEYSVRGYMGEAVMTRAQSRKIKDNQCCAVM